MLKVTSITSIKRLSKSKSASSGSQLKLLQKPIRIHFKSLVKLILELRRLNAGYSLKNKINDEIFPLIQNITFIFDEPPKAAFFDPKEFKADRQFRVPDEIRKILRKESFDRTEDEIKLVCIFLKRIEVIREYPIRMQYMIAKYGNYERYDCKRIIVRQGHRAASFYILLSGSVIVIIMTDDRTSGRVVTYLNKGQSFGELAIINKTVRQSTVVAKETVEFLTISIKDFHDVFMSHGIKMIMDPDYDDFINASFLKKFPKQLLANNSEKFFFQYYRSDEILARNTNNSKWIYLVKSGEISIIYLEKKKKSVKQKTGNQYPMQMLSQLVEDGDNEEEDTMRMLMRQHHNIRTIAEDYDLAFKNKETDITLFKDFNWIQVHSLRRGDTMGLSQCFYENQPALLLVSQGVEVFMLDKAFFLFHCPYDKIVELKNSVLVYPEELQLQALIKRHRDWNNYKRQTLLSCLQMIKRETN